MPYAIQQRKQKSSLFTVVKCSKNICVVQPTGALCATSFVPNKAGIVHNCPVDYGTRHIACK